MARTVSEALQRAADRAKRRVELEVARDIVERNLGHQLADDEFGWLSVLLEDRRASLSSATTKPSSTASSRSSAHSSSEPGSTPSSEESPGASSNATTIPATDAEAMENARKGLKAARKLEAEQPQPPLATAPASKLRRINSVPILEPVTPLDRIHRRTTPTPDALQSLTNGETGPEEQDQEMPSGDKPKRKSKNKRAKKAKKNNMPSEQHENGMDAHNGNGEQAEPANDTQDDSNQEPAAGTAVPAVAVPAVDQANVPQPGNERPVKRQRATASKAAAKPPQQTSPQETPQNGAALPATADMHKQVKMQPTPMRTEAADGASKKTAEQDNLTRANTQEQLPPATPASASKGQSENKSIEDQLDAEIKKEDEGQQTQANAQSPAAPDTDVKTKKQRKEKTPAQKAAHARYMKFSRSFERRDCPKEMKRAYNNAHYCKEKLAVLRDAWEQCEGDWKRSALYKRFVEKSTTTQHGARVWLTRSQVAKKYESQALADKICNAKLQDEETKEKNTKEHPDCPGDEDMMLFLVWDSEGISEKKDTIVEDLFEACDCDTDDESRGKDKSKKRKKKRSSSGSSDDESEKTSDNGSDSDDDQAKKEKKKKGKKDKAGKRSKGSKGGKKKESKEKKEARLQKEQARLDKEKARDELKAQKELFNKAKKALTQLNDKIVDASGREKGLSKLVPELRNAISAQFIKKKNSMCDMRLKIQTQVDKHDDSNLLSLISDAQKVIEEHTQMLSRSNMK